MPTPPSRYHEPSALLAALRDRARSAAASHPEVTPAQLHTEFVHRRFLARVFAPAGGERWVLKGGVALLARVADARHSRDIDLHDQLGDLDAAIDSLRDLCRRDLGDHFRFTIARITRRPPTPEQPSITGAQVSIAVTCGATTLPNLRLDIVVGGLVTAPPERHAPATRLALPGMDDPEYLLYPVVDHITDKVCATAAAYGSRSAPSSRPRDLVDLVVLARTSTVDADLLKRAIAAERHHRGPRFVDDGDIGGRHAGCESGPPSWSERRGAVAECVPRQVVSSRSLDGCHAFRYVGTARRPARPTRRAALDAGDRDESSRGLVAASTPLWVIPGRYTE